MNVRLTQPVKAVANRLDALRETGGTRIGLFYSQQTARFNPSYSAVQDEAIRQWELLLIGLELPYMVLEDSSLAGSVPDSLRLLIVPAAEALSSTQELAIRQYLERGGGLIAAGRIGLMDHRGVVQNYRFFREIFGADLAVELPDSVAGLLHTLEGGHPPTAGLPSGFRLNVQRPASGMAAIPAQSQAMGRIIPYEETAQSSADPTERSTLLLHGSYGDGRFVWLGFDPQDVASEDRQQAIYQAFILNAMAYAAGVPSASIRPWPEGYRSAASLVMMPSPGYQPYPYRSSVDLILRALESSRASSTFFLVSGQVNDHPDLLRRMAGAGELAVSSDTDDLLVDQPEDLQQDRLRNARLALSRATSDPVVGLYPPGGYFDVRTLHALTAEGFRYMLSNEKGSGAPEFLPWESLLDYRDPWMANATGSAPEIGQLQPASRRLLLFHPSLFSYELASPSRQSAGGFDRLVVLKSSFARTHLDEGHFVFTYEPEFMGMSRQRAGELEEFTKYMQEHATWFTTLGEVAAWWLKRAQVSIELLRPSATTLEIVVTNDGAELLRGVSLDVNLGAGWEAPVDVAAESLEVVRNFEGTDMRFVIRALPPGAHSIRLTTVQGSSSVGSEAVQE